MRKLFTMIIAIAAMQSTYAATITDTISTGAQYANQVWYSLPNDEQGSSPKDNWDVAFEISGYAASVIANIQKGIVVYQAPYALAQWATVDTTGIDSWQVLSNSEEYWEEGAFNNYPDANFDLGWGEYDMNTHAVTGDSVYVIKLASGSWKKFKINSLANSTYSFTWADLNGQNEQTGSVLKSDFTGKNFGYFSLENNTIVQREPATADWDITFTKYMTVTQGMPYAVTGVLLNKGVTAIKASGVDVATVEYVNYTFQNAINTIGWDWKAYTGTWAIEDSLAFFVKRGNGDIWKVIFTGFTGGTLGNYIFTKEQVYTANVGIKDVEEITTLGVYPNPSNNVVNVIYNYDNNTTKDSGINIYDLSGRIVLQHSVNMTTGLNQQAVDVSSLNKGIYMLTINGTSKATKLIVE